MGPHTPNLERHGDQGPGRTEGQTLATEDYIRDGQKYRRGRGRRGADIGRGI